VTAAARSQIAYEQAALGAVLKQHQLEVPPNQREYAWGQEQVTQLFQDLAKAVSDGDDYFLGTIVTIPRKSGTLEVVDGQQRLATTAIFLAAIRDYLRSNNEEVLVESINNEFLTGIDRAKRARVAKLKLNVDDNELFAQLVTRKITDPLPTALHPSQERLLIAYEEASRYVRQLVAIVDVKDQGDVLNRWVSFIENQALVVLLRVPDDANAYKMFETLNDRGLRTSQVDLIKNHLFGHAGTRFNEVQARWSYMRGALESLDDEDITINYLRHALINIRGFLRESAVYDAVQNLARSEQATITFCSQLETLANLYVATFNSEHEKWNEYPSTARSAIEVLNLFNIKPLRPLILAISVSMDKKNGAKSLELLAVLGVRLLIASSTRSGSVETPVAEVAHKVFGRSIETIADLKKGLSTLMPSDLEFRQAFEVARVSNARFARYYLRSLEAAAKTVPDPWFIPQTNETVINLEHVLPRKPESNWPDWTDEEMRVNTTRLGNLALLRASDNSGLKSGTFADKRKVYAMSPYLLTSQIADCENWTSTSISERQKGLADLAVKTWPI